MNRRVIIISLLAGLSQLVMVQLLAQDRQVFVQNRESAQGAAIAVKWFSADFLYPEGVNLYRRTPGADWQLITPTPIVLDAYTPTEEAAREELEFFNAVLKAPSQETFREEMILLQFVLQGILDNDFARHAGIYFEDTNIRLGETYEYRAMQLRNGTEVPIGESAPLTAAAPQPLSAISSLEALQEEQHVIFNWQPEEDRFFGVNIYKAEGEAAETLLNEYPLVISMIEDSLGNLTYPTPMFKEDRLRQNTRYTYRVVGVDYFGQETESSPPITIDFKDVVPPAAPYELISRADSMKVHLDWAYEELEVIKGFRLYRSPYSEGPFELVTPVELPREARHYTDSLILPGPYYYILTAVDLNGNEGKSFPIFEEVQDIMPPAAPMGISIQADSGLITLAWEAGLEPDLAGYLIYRTSQADQANHYVLLNSLPQQETVYYDTLSGNIRSSFYYYVVAADTSYNRSEPSERLSAKMPDLLGPDKPFLKGIEETIEYVEIIWIKNADNDLMGYNLYKRPAGQDSIAGTQVNLNPIDRDAALFRDRSFQKDSAMGYYLVAYDSAGNNSRPSNILVNYRNLSTETTGAIELSIKYNKRKKHNRLSWSVSASEQLLGYVLYRGSNADSCRPYTGLMQDTEYTDRVSAKKEKYYQIRAYYSDGAVISSQIKTD